MTTLDPGPIARALLALDQIIVERAPDVPPYLSPRDKALIVKVVLASLREPSPRTLDLIIDELADLHGQSPDPCADPSGQPERLITSLTARETRLRLTYGWRRAIDGLARQADLAAPPIPSFPDV